MLTDLRKEVTITDPQISPNGNSIAILVGRSDFEHDTVPVHIVMVNVESDTTRTLPIPATEIVSVRWSPHGDRIAFLAAQADDSRQLYVASPDGTNLRKLTSNPQGVDYFSWRPDGHALGYAAQDSPPKKYGPDRFNKSFIVGDNDYLATARPLPAHLWVVSASTGKSTPLTTGTSIVPSGGFIEPAHYPDHFFCWVRGGRSIVYTKAPDAYAPHWTRSVMEVRDLSTGAERRLTRHAGLEAGCDVSPDGRRVAYWYPHAGAPLGASVIFVANPSARGDGAAVSDALDRSPWVVRWIPAGTSLLIVGHDGTRERMWLTALDGSVRRLEIGDLNASGASVSRSGAIAFTASGPQRPTELYVMPSSSAAPRRLTNLNTFFSTLHLGAVGRIEWRNDGFDENGVLTYPPDFVAGKKYPLVLQIHGWPQYASHEAFDTDYPGLTQLLAAHGYVVFEPNYRGSDNMGSAFESAITGDTVEGPSRDIMAGIEAVKALGIVDESRIGVSGWSYGGQLTAWLIGHHAWRAAMAGAAPTDQAVDYAISSYNVLGTLFLDGPAWQSKT
ncbi:MAG: prolyl oligopeptidase family serine peptidase, partial [Candidatus Eremiobacteraeota bacterium]|nr:prolyl oligopeptidase family serine peptidase [Candidatus Eremiobacteraeota bacterium]